MKRIVHYVEEGATQLVVGHPAFITAVDHPEATNGDVGFVRTSRVIRINLDNGEFETLNSIYRPLRPEKQAVAECHKLCDQCETVAYCSKNGCIPKVFTKGAT